MRYYSTIIINLNQNLIKIYDLAIPCTKKEAIMWAKNQERIDAGVILCTIETKEIVGRNALQRFNLKNIQRKEVYF